MQDELAKLFSEDIDRNFGCKSVVMPCNNDLSEFSIAFQSDKALTIGFIVRARSLEGFKKQFGIGLCKELRGESEFFTFNLLKLLLPLLDYYSIGNSQLGIGEGIIYFLEKCLFQNQNQNQAAYLTLWSSCNKGLGAIRFNIVLYEKILSEVNKFKSIQLERHIQYFILMEKHFNVLYELGWSGRMILLASPEAYYGFNYLNTATTKLERFQYYIASKEFNFLLLFQRFYGPSIYYFICLLQEEGLLSEIIQLIMPLWIMATLVDEKEEGMFIHRQ